MSDATINQGIEGIQNGVEGKNMTQEEFSSSYLQTTSQPGYGLPPNDQYMPSYYGQMAFPSYMGEWSTAGESVPYLSSYNNMGNGEPHNYMQDAMFGQQPTGLNNGQQYFSPPVFRHGNEFTAWTSPAPHARSLDAGPGHPIAPNSYTGDFYQQMMPPITHDYVGRSNVIGSSVGMGPHNGQTGMISTGDNSTKLTASPSAINVIEHGIGTLNVQGMCGDNETIVGKNKNQVNVSAVASQVDNGPMQTTYNTSQIQPKLLPDNSVQQVPSVSKPISWAAIASKPAKPQPKPKVKPQVGLPPPVKHNIEVGSWDSKKTPQRGMLGPHYGSGVNNWNTTSGFIYEPVGEELFDQADTNIEKQAEETTKNQTVAIANPVLDKLKFQNEYNPKRLTMDLRNSRFFVIKSYSEDDIHRSIKYNIWCSTEHGNKRLDATYRSQKNRGPVLLLYSVNGSGHFCGVAEMKTCVDYSSRAGVWSQDKWKGKFQVKWIYVKDVPNTVLRHIRLENNDNKPVTNSRDTQEVPAEKGRQVLKIIANYKHQTSIFDDFGHYERRQQEEETQKNRAAQAAMVTKAGESPQTGSSKTNNFA